MENIKKSNDLALFLGMFAGDGALPVKHNGDGYRNYQVCFYNTKKSYTELFLNLFVQLTGVNAAINCRIREGRKPLWQVEKYSKKAFDLIHYDWEIPEGKKARNVFVPSFIFKGSEDIKKNFFLGLLITDGCVRKDDRIGFHLSSKKLIEGLIIIIEDLWDIRLEMKEYNQRGFSSFQINLNKRDSLLVLNSLPTSHNLVLR